jgi:hypothetical protein
MTDLERVEMAIRRLLPMMREERPASVHPIAYWFDRLADELAAVEHERYELRIKQENP